MTYSTSTSRWISAATLGRNTLTTTACPSCSRAACTCAIEAAASAVRSNSANTCSTGRPNAAASAAAASSPANGGTWSWSFASSAAMSGGSRSGRTDSAWPNFTKIGPSSSSASRRRTPSGLRRRPNASSRPTHASGRNRCVRQTISSRPCFTSTRWIDEHAGELSQTHAPHRRCSRRVEPCGRALDVVAQPLHVGVERLRLERRRHRTAFLLQVLGRVHAQRGAGARKPRSRSAHGLAERVRRHVADPLRDFLLEIGPRELQQLRETLRDLEIAGELRARALDAADAVGVQQAQQIERRRAQRGRRVRGVGVERAAARRRRARRRSAQALRRARRSSCRAGARAARARRSTR